MAVTYLRAACNLGEPTSCGSLAYHYARGAGVPADPTKGVIYAKQACNTGAKNGCYQLGTLQLEGLGTARDRDGGLQLLRKTCDLGEQRACEAAKRLATTDSQPAANASGPTK
jgi:uncharacterized protein